MSCEELQKYEAYYDTLFKTVDPTVSIKIDIFEIILSLFMALKCSIIIFICKHDLSKLERDENYVKWCNNIKRTKDLTQYQLTLMMNSRTLSRTDPSIPYPPPWNKLNSVVDSAILFDQESKTEDFIRKFESKLIGYTPEKVYQIVGSNIRYMKADNTFTNSLNSGIMITILDLYTVMMNNIAEQKRLFDVIDDQFCKDAIKGPFLKQAQSRWQRMLHSRPHFPRPFSQALTAPVTPPRQGVVAGVGVTPEGGANVQFLSSLHQISENFKRPIQFDDPQSLATSASTSAAQSREGSPERHIRMPALSKFSVKKIKPQELHDALQTVADAVNAVAEVASEAKEALKDENDENEVAQLQTAIENIQHVSDKLENLGHVSTKGALITNLEHIDEFEEIAQKALHEAHTKAVDHNHKKLAKTEEAAEKQLTRSITTLKDFINKLRPVRSRWTLPWSRAQTASSTHTQASTKVSGTPTVVVHDVPHDAAAASPEAHSPHAAAAAAASSAAQSGSPHGAAAAAASSKAPERNIDTIIKSLKHNQYNYLSELIPQAKSKPTSAKPATPAPSVSRPSSRWFSKSSSKKPELSSAKPEHHYFRTAASAATSATKYVARRTGLSSSQGHIVDFLTGNFDEDSCKKIPREFRQSCLDAWEKIKEEKPPTRAKFFEAFCESIKYHHTGLFVNEWSSRHQYFEGFKISIRKRIDDLKLELEIETEEKRKTEIRELIIDLDNSIKVIVAFQHNQDPEPPAGDKSLIYSRLDGFHVFLSRDQLATNKPHTHAQREYRRPVSMNKRGVEIFVVPFNRPHIRSE